MRKSWIWFLLSGMALTTCYEKPEFPIVPEIGLNDFYFFQANDLQDSMIFVIDFTDGDGDVDFVIEAGHSCPAFEQKSLARWRKRDLAGLKAF